MSTYVHISCPGCDHELNVRSEYVGKKLNCNRCGKTFRAKRSIVKAEAQLNNVEPILPRDVEPSELEALGKTNVPEWPDGAPAVEPDHAPATAGPAEEMAKLLEAERLRSEELQTELTEAEAKLRDLHQEVDSLQKQAEDARVEEARLREKLGRARDRMKAREEEVQVFLRDVKTKRDKLAKKLQASRSEVEVAAERERALTDVAEALRVKVDHQERVAHESSTRLETERDELASALETSKAEQRQLTERNSRAETEVTRLREQLSEDSGRLADQLKAVENEANTHRTALESARQEQDELQGRLDADQHVHREEVERLTRSLEESRQQAESAERSARQERDDLQGRLEADQHAHREEVERLARSLEELSQRAESADRKAAEQESQIEILRSELEAARTAAEAKQEPQPTSEAVAEDQETLAASQKRVAELETKLTASEWEMSQLRQFMRRMGIQLP